MFFGRHIFSVPTPFPFLSPFGVFRGFKTPAPLCVGLVSIFPTRILRSQQPPFPNHHQIFFRKPQGFLGPRKGFFSPFFLSPRSNSFTKRGHFLTPREKKDPFPNRTPTSPFSPRVLGQTEKGEKISPPHGTGLLKTRREIPQKRHPRAQIFGETEETRGGPFPAIRRHRVSSFFFPPVRHSNDGAPGIPVPHPGGLMLFS
ncbi:unnamed protein product [Acanthosepion pharaonis]|uniref:Uncharacterized protein n=1 Tax=Acanthosepion pharaonis TaxID=158019 RepID=A0A812D6W1_ACAPH|nr:unnamed protein product [Sepia pharaonis]